MKEEGVSVLASVLVQVTRKVNIVLDYEGDDSAYFRVFWHNAPHYMGKMHECGVSLDPDGLWRVRTNIAQVGYSKPIAAVKAFVKRQIEIRYEETKRD